MSKENMSNALDLGRKTIFRIINTLEERGLIVRNERGYLKSTDEYNEQIANKEDWMIGFKGKETSYLSAKVSKQCQNDTNGVKVTLPQCQNDTPDGVNMTPNNNIYNNSNNISSKEERKQSFRGPFGNEEINQMLSSVMRVVECDDFRESKKQQRIWGKNLVVLKNKLGLDTFKERLIDILSDDFKKKNSSSLQYLFKEIKSFIS